MITQRPEVLPRGSLYLLLNAIEKDGGIPKTAKIGNIAAALRRDRSGAENEWAFLVLLSIQKYTNPKLLQKIQF